MTKSIQALEVPLRAVALLSDCKGAYGIGINPSSWVRSFIRTEYRGLIDHWDAINELDAEMDEPIEDDEFICEEVDEPDDEVDEPDDKVDEPDDKVDEPDEHKTDERIEGIVDELIHEIYRPLVLRPDVIRASAFFPNKQRNTLLHTIGNTCWIASYESVSYTHLTLPTIYSV